MATNRFFARTGVLCVVVSLIWLLAPSSALAAPIMPSSPTHGWAFDEGTGSTVAPCFGSQTGTRYDGTEWSEDSPLSYNGNNSAYFDTKPGTVRFPSHLSGSSGSYQFWFRTYDMDAGAYYMNSPSGPGRMYVYIFGANENSVGYGLNGVLGTGSFPTPPHGIWNHLVVTWDESLYDAGQNNVKVYVTNSNGQNVYSARKELGVTNTGIIRIGGTGSTSGFEGLLDEVAFWNAPLSAENVEWLYENSMSKIPEPATATLAVLSVLALLVAGRRRGRRKVV